MYTLTFNSATRKVGQNQTPRDYFDFFISGVSLKSMLNIEHADYITPFGWMPNKEYSRHILNVFRLKEKSELESGRIMLYVCPECGDIGCGAITAEIKDMGDRIIWKNLGFETGFTDVADMYEQVKLIEFERANYFKALSKLPV